MFLSLKNNIYVKKDGELIPVTTENNLSELEQQLNKHSSKVASKDNLGHIRVGSGLSITEDGVLSVSSAAPTIYGVEIDEDNSDPFGAVTYIADSEGFEPLYTGDGNVDLGSWGDKFPINKVKIVLLKDGEVVEELNKNDYTKTVDGRTVDITSGDSGDVMVAIPLTFWKFERVGSKLCIYVSEHEIDEEYKAYAHSRDGVVQDDYLYIGAYKGNVQDDKLRSLYDVMSTGNVTISKFREYATNNGAGYGQMNWVTMTLLQIFTVLLTKSLDSQTALGRGYGNDKNSWFIKNGETVDKGLFYGETTGKKQMKFLGLEDFYGNRYEWVDGLVNRYSSFWTNTNNTNYNDDAVDYTETERALSFNADIKKVIGTTESGFIPSEGGGSSSTYYCDEYWQRSSSRGSRVAAFGGARLVSYGAGAFRLLAGDAPADTDQHKGARLIYLKGGN